MRNGLFFYVLLVLTGFIISGCGKSTAELIQKSTAELIQDLNSNDVQTQKNAFKELGERKDPAAVEPLIGFLAQPNSPEASFARRALVEIGDPRAIGPLANLLRGAGATDPKTQADGLIEFGDPAAAYFITELQQPSYGQEHYPQQPYPSFEIFGETISGQVSAPAYILGNIGGPDDLHQLDVVLANGNANARTDAANALGLKGGASTAEPLKKALGDESAGVRYAAANSLVSVDPGLTQFLVDALNNRDIETVASAYPFYIRKGIPGSEPVLIEALNAHGSQWMAQMYLNSGNGQLEAAANTWASNNGFWISTSYAYGTSGSSASQWGSSSDR